MIGQIGNFLRLQTEKRNRIKDAFVNAGKRIEPFANSMKQELQISDDKFFIVGGFVRDTVVGDFLHTDIESKDYDVVLSKKIDFTNNPNVIWQKQNNFGGLKIATKNIPEIDIFDKYTDRPEYLIANFDFNCNMVWYSNEDKSIVSSPLFEDFLMTQTIEPYRFDFFEGYQRYKNEDMAARALKFYAKFNEYGMKLRFDGVLYDLFLNMDKRTEKAMFDYINSKIKSDQMKKQMIDTYKKIRQ